MKIYAVFFLIFFNFVYCNGDDPQGGETIQNLDTCDHPLHDMQSKISDPLHWGYLQAMCSTEFDIDCVNEFLGFSGAYADYLQKLKYPSGLGFGPGCAVLDPACDASIKSVLTRLNETSEECVCLFLHSICAETFPTGCEKDVLGLIQSYRDRKIQGSTGRNKRAVDYVENSKCNWIGTGFRPLDTSATRAIRMGADKFRAWKNNDRLEITKSLIETLNNTGTETGDKSEETPGKEKEAVTPIGGDKGVEATKLGDKADDGTNTGENKEAQNGDKLMTGQVIQQEYVKKNQSNRCKLCGEIYILTACLAAVLGKMFS